MDNSLTFSTSLRLIKLLGSVCAFGLFNAAAVNAADDPFPVIERGSPSDSIFHSKTPNDNNTLLSSSKQSSHSNPATISSSKRGDLSFLDGNELILSSNKDNPLKAKNYSEYLSHSINIKANKIKEADKRDLSNGFDVYNNESFLPADSVLFASKANENTKSLVFNPKTSFSLFAVSNTYANTFWGSSAAPALNKLHDQLYSQYTFVIASDTSFFGRDSLKISGILSNYQFNSPGCGSPLLSTSHFYCFPTNNSLQLFRAWYTYHLSDEFKVTVSPRMYTYDLLPVSTAMYSPKGATMIGLKSLLFDFVDYASVPGTYPLTLGPGGGFSYSKNGWAFGAGFVAQLLSSDPSQVGMLDNNNGSTAVAQLSYTSQRYGFQAAWTNTIYSSDSLKFNFAQSTGLGTNPFGFLTSMAVNTAAIGGYYYIIPQRFSISGGINYSFYNATSSGSNPAFGQFVNSGDTAYGNAWLLTLQYERFLANSLTLGSSFGQIGMIRGNTSTVGTDDSNTPPWMILGFLNWQANKYLGITPYLYWTTASNSINYSTGGPVPTTSSFGANLMVTLTLY